MLLTAVPFPALIYKELLKMMTTELLSPSPRKGLENPNISKNLSLAIRYILTMLQLDYTEYAVMCYNVKT